MFLTLVRSSSCEDAPARSVAIRQSRDRRGRRAWRRGRLRCGGGTGNLSETAGRRCLGRSHRCRAARHPISTHQLHPLLDEGLAQLELLALPPGARHGGLRRFWPWGNGVCSPKVDRSRAERVEPVVCGPLAGRGGWKQCPRGAATKSPLLLPRDARPEYATEPAALARPGGPDRLPHHVRLHGQGHGRCVRGAARCPRALRPPVRSLRCAAADAIP